MVTRTIVRPKSNFIILSADFFYFGGELQLDLEKQIIDKIIEIGNRYDEVKKITLFGSRARNDNQSRSDIDIAVYFHNKQNPNVIAALEDIETLLKIYVTVISDTLDKSFLCNVKNEEVILYMGKFENKYNNFIKALNKLEQAVNQLNTNDDQFKKLATTIKIPNQ